MPRSKICVYKINMFCKNCGKEQIKGAENFCGYCGEEIKTREENFSIKTKNCAFCKVKIGFDNKECPNCKRILVEKISSGQKHETHTPEFKNKRKDNIAVKFIIRIKNINYSKLILNRYVAILVGVVFLVWILSGDNTSYNSGGAKAPLPAPIQQVSENSSDSNLNLSAFDVSLNNGTVLKKNSIYFRGHGELEIKNGTSLD